MTQNHSSITDITDLINDALEADRKEIEEAEYEFTDPDWIPESVQTGGNGVSSIGGHETEGDWDNGSHGVDSTVYALSLQLNSGSMGCMPIESGLMPVAFHTMMQSSFMPTGTGLSREEWERQGSNQFPPSLYIGSEFRSDR